MLIRHGRVVAEAQFEHDYAAIYKALGPDVIQVGVNNADLQYNYDHPDFHPYYQQSELHTPNNLNLDWFGYLSLHTNKRQKVAEHSLSSSLHLKRLLVQ